MFVLLRSALLLALVSVHFLATTSRAAARRRGHVAGDAAEREGKLFSLFSVVSFDNDPCRTNSALSSGSSPFRNGTCFTASECASRAGSAQGSCASGFGVCCLFTVSETGSRINQNCTYVQNPGFPSALSDTNSLTYTVNKVNSGICALRLDFETFSLLGPENTTETNGGVCQDSFTVDAPSSGVTVPTICGENSGEHIYVELGADASATAAIDFDFADVTTTARQFEIKVSQIPCAANYRPPDGCLQYFTARTGRLTTFNFQAATTAQSHLANQRYTQCIRRASGFCCIQYQTCNGVSDAFTLHQEDGAITGSDCTADFLTIESASDVCQPQSSVSLTSRYCGNVFSNTLNATMDGVVCDCTPPFEVAIRTDNTNDTNSETQSNRGVCLDYTQLPC